MLWAPLGLCACVTGWGSSAAWGREAVASAYPPSRNQKSPLALESRTPHPETLPADSHGRGLSGCGNGRVLFHLISEKKQEAKPLILEAEKYHTSWGFRSHRAPSGAGLCPGQRCTPFPHSAGGDTVLWSTADSAVCHKQPGSQPPCSAGHTRWTLAADLGPVPGPGAAGRGCPSCSLIRGLSCYQPHCLAWLASCGAGPWRATSGAGGVSSIAGRGMVDQWPGQRAAD